jgi:glycerophosphoryl diester phosphodiesterase
VGVRAVVAGSAPASKVQHHGRVLRFEDLPPGFVIAHRGGALQVPEHTIEGYAVAVEQDLPVIEPDVQVLADGQLGVMHDGTVDRTTSSTGNVADHTAASWKQLVLDAATYLGGGWGDLRAPLFEEVLTAFSGSVLLCPEAKSAGTMAPMLDALERRGLPRSSVLVQSFSLAECRAAVARGVDVVWLGSSDPARAAAEGIGWIGPAAAAVTAELCEAARAVGVRTAVHTVNRRWRRDALRACGVDAIFSDDPAYLHSDAVLGPCDLFARQTWVPGMQADGAERGRFFADDASYGFDLPAGAGDDASSEAVSCALVGYLRPPDPDAFTLAVSLRLDGTTGRDGGGWILLATTDRPYAEGSAAGVDGYRFGLERSGRLCLERVTDGVATPLGATAPVTAVDPAVPVPLRITVTRTGVALVRTDTGEAVTADDATHRGLACTHLGARAAGVRFREVVFS